MNQRFLVFRSLLCLMLLGVTGGLVEGSVVSTSGNIDFDINDDVSVGGSYEAKLNATGLAIGANLTPGANLHVGGDALLTGAITIGGETEGSSNLMLSGTMGMGYEMTSTNITLGASSLVLADSASSNLTLRLPEASSVGEGRIYEVKKISTSNKVDVIRGGNIDGGVGVRLSSGALGQVKLISSSGNWYILSVSGNGDFWSPAEISSAAWYDASDEDSLMETGGAVSQWNDKSGNDHHLAQGTPSRQPTTGSNLINGLNALKFVSSGGPDGLTVISNLPNFDFLAIVLSYSGTARLSQAVGHNSSANGENYTIQYRGDVNPDRWQNPYFTDGSDSSSTSGALSVYDTALVVRTNSLTNFPLSVGVDRYLAGRSWDGLIAEMICGSGALDAGTKDKLEGYLAWKWGLEGSLPADHPYKNDVP